MTADQRRRSRVKAAFLVELARQGVYVTAETLNISLKGILCSYIPGFAIEDECSVHLRLSEEIEIVVKGRVVRSDKDGIAIDFMQMDDDSFTHLRKIVQYNSLDADTIDGELTLPAFDS